METIPPLKKGDTGGFAFDFICRERSNFLNELQRRHRKGVSVVSYRYRLQRPIASPGLKKSGLIPLAVAGNFQVIFEGRACLVGFR